MCTNIIIELYIIILKQDRTSKRCSVFYCAERKEEWKQVEVIIIIKIFAKKLGEIILKHIEED